MKSCPAITYFKFDTTKISNIFGRSSKHSMINLKRLKARWTKMNDEAMAMIGNRRLDLQHLDIKRCEEMTDNGVMEVVKNCKDQVRLNCTAAKCECQYLASNVIFNAFAYATLIF